MSMSVVALCMLSTENNSFKTFKSLLTLQIKKSKYEISDTSDSSIAILNEMNP